VAPINQVLPVIEGEPVVGFTVFGDQGTWTGDMPQTYTLQWLRDGVPIDQPFTGSSIAHSHVVEVADQGHALTLQATARNAAGSTTVASAPLVVPGATSPGGGALAGGDRTPSPSDRRPSNPPASASVASVGRSSVRGGVVLVPVSCSGGSDCSKITATLSVLEQLRGGRVVAISSKKRLRTKRVVVGSASVQLGAGQGATLRVGLNRAGRLLLRRLGSCGRRCASRSGRRSLQTPGTRLSGSI
jgi:hypothetical protein